MQEDHGALLNRSYSLLLCSTFLGTAASASQVRGQGQPANVPQTQGQSDVDLAACTRLVDEWDRQLANAGLKPTPASAAAAEAMAAVRMLGQLQYAAGKPQAPLASWHPIQGVARMLY
jgi:hypothetical protein